ncbi:MAG: hypothetical protein HGA87_03550 [Desulfobulbaceae bacterium]|nr:hypothetical protein [Desulfobulbaceae bacterium]
MIEPPKILDSTKPILYETGYEEWPYAYAGSCFPVRWKNKLYIVSAFHCFENHQVEPEATLYPIPVKQDHFFGYCCMLRAKVNEAKDLKHYDQLLLQVSHDIHSDKEIGSVNAFDLSDSQSLISLSSPDVLDVWLRGFLLENPGHEVDYEALKIRQQAYVTNGLVSSRNSLFNYCHMLKVKTPVPAGMSLNGMSGSAAYAVDKNGNVKFAGTVIEHNSFTDEFLVIDSLVLSELLRAENA